MLHFRLVVPGDQLAQVLATLDDAVGACNQILLPGAARRPDGDVVLVDVPSEAGNTVLASLRALGLHRTGSISVERIDTALSERHARAEQEATGDPGEAIIWEEVEWRLRREAGWSLSFAVLLVLAVLLAAVGILLDSPILIVGAMVVGPEYGALASLAWGLAHRRRRWLVSGSIALAGGFALGMLSAFVFGLLIRGFGWVPAPYEQDVRPLTNFIARPDGWSFVVAILAAIAGTVSLTEAKTGTLVGVLVSVTTVPAAGNCGLAVAFGKWSEAGGAALQLLVNLVCVVVAGALTIIVLRYLGRHAGRRRSPVASRP